MSDPNDYTVGWICAIDTEYVAAQEFLDEEHPRLASQDPNDNNIYTLGRVGQHNVVIACLPHWNYGLVSAANVASDMLRTFTNVRFGLMVGVGGGVPTKQDIRLGDVVVSSLDYANGAVYQYDFGQTVQDKAFRATGHLDAPPLLLQAAVQDLKTTYRRHGNQIDKAIAAVLERNPRLEEEYRRPDPITDRLYKNTFTHAGPSHQSCTSVCGDDESTLIIRDARQKYDDNPKVHYGLIASSNQLMKDALVRDRLAEEKGVLCFEMEAAGLMNHFKCLVIRGICDYSDSHKNEAWKGYAAMAAAAYAKDLLGRIAPSRVEAEEKIRVLSRIYEVVEKAQDIAKQGLQTQIDFARERMSEKENMCLQLFFLTTDGKDATYESYKDRVEERVDGTCMWFLEHENFQKWLKQESGPLLVSADPGCGKSVLAKYLIDHYLPRSATICYYFFKDQDQNTVRQALCALLHQLLTKKPSLIEHAISQYDKKGKGLINSTKSLWEVLQIAVKDPQAGPIIIVLDALDECAQSEFEDLIRNIERQFPSDHFDHGKLKYILTCRPYDQIVSEFSNLLHSFPNIRIPGEEESETISQEVNHVITCRINQLSTTKRLNSDIKSHLEKRLQETSHRTYLWVHLVFDYLEGVDFKKTLKGLESTMTTLPKSVNEAYEKILNKSNDKERRMVRKVLSVILAASRPLTLSEMNVAVNIEDTSESFRDLDLEDEEDFERRLRSWCGLFVLIHHRRVYFLHQTAREFLLADLASPTTVSPELHWHHSITAQDAHAVLAELCVRYLNFFNSDTTLPTDANGAAGHPVDGHAFLDYSAKNWGAHFREASIIDDAAIVPPTTKICNPDSKSYSTWFTIYWEMTHTKCFTDLMVASHFGLNAVVKQLLENGAELEAKDETGRTPLVEAIEGQHVAIVKRLLETGAKVDYHYQRRVSESDRRRMGDNKDDS
ncbi:hypothetical protein B0I35DRAFT_183940 [Stachybotrys elegans]|uniref:Nucleoside phosphorylase domain-containing protein n=1 Tax=Stachybotrys elegans TaxID=80388 RepID=A0A8K0SYT2_9HYPO|nr:hypothetical protein B0I35DRAFT_183940 [Stachybotrys elegans]